MPRGTIPAQDLDLQAFAIPLSAALTANPTSLACTTSMATQLASRLSSFSSALAIAKDATTRGHHTIFLKDEAKTLLVAYLRLVIRQIQGASTVSDSQRDALGLPPINRIPTHPPAPGTPEKFKAQFTALGALELSWKCSNPTGGTMYTVWRKIGDAEPTFVCNCGTKKIVDSSLPAGTSQVTYQIQAQRSTAAGAWATFVVTIGVAPSGAATTAVTQSPVKIAA